ncbi:unnamed protein product [Mytilus coruscus]|uniref:Uncharacterized protein n=1 Tax=Mytilus coruscus TaxID=42192 RepID=A0A6J8EUY1_MYTCO|nr:unnamed protein product [Mytilus coruscus]
MKRRLMEQPQKAFSDVYAKIRNVYKQLKLPVFVKIILFYGSGKWCFENIDMIEQFCNRTLNDRSREFQQEINVTLRNISVCSRKVKNEDKSISYVYQLCRVLLYQELVRKRKTTQYLDRLYTSSKIDNTSKRIDYIYIYTTYKIDNTSNSLDYTTNKINCTSNRIDYTINTIDNTSKKIDYTATCNKIDNTSNNIDYATNKIECTSNRMDYLTNHILVDNTSNRIDYTTTKIDCTSNRIDYTTNTIYTRQVTERLYN